jgi:hypothetical protein
MRGVDSVDDIVVTTFKIDIHAHFFTRFVLILAILVDTSLSVLLALCLQLLISWACHEHVNVAFNLLRRGPINLSILLRTLHTVLLIMKLDAASVAAGHLVHVAGCPESLSVSTSVGFKAALGLITFCVNILMFSDSFRTCSVLFCPFRIAPGCPSNVRLKHVANFAVARVMDDHTLFLVAIRTLEVVNPEVQRIALDNFVNVFCMDILSAFFMLQLRARHEPEKFIDLGLVIIVSTFALVPTSVKLVDSFLVVRVLILECPLDVTKEEPLDGLECLLNV